MLHRSICDPCALAHPGSPGHRRRFYRDVLASAGRRRACRSWSAAPSRIACYTGIRAADQGPGPFHPPRGLRARRRACCARPGLARRADAIRTGWPRCYGGEDFIDLIFNSGNGVRRSTTRWFRDNARGRQCSACRCASPTSRRRPAVQGLHHGARALRRRRRRAPAAGQRRAARLAAPAAPLRRALARAARAPRCCSASSIRASAHRVPDWVMEQLLDAAAAETRPPLRRRIASLRRARCCRASSTCTTSSGRATATGGSHRSGR